MRLRDRVALHGVVDDGAEDHAHLPDLHNHDNEGEEHFPGIVRQSGSVGHGQRAEAAIQAHDVLRGCRRGEAVVERDHMLQLPDPGRGVEILHLGEKEEQAAHPVRGHKDDNTVLEHL